MSEDRPFLGVLLMLAFCALAPLADGIAKLLGASTAILILVLARFAVQAVVLLPLSRGRMALPDGMLVWVSLRTILHITGISLMILSLRYLPLADALAIAFVMPFLLLILGGVFAGETVGPHRWAACGVGFLGTLLVIQPNFVDVGSAALLPLGVALVFCLFMMVTRVVARRVDPIPLQAISGLQATTLLILVLAGAVALDHPVDLPSTHGNWGLLVGMGLIGTLAHLFMTWSLRFAPSSTLAPMQYLEIPFATAVGWIMFSDLPNGLAALGICITVSAGLYIVLRERRKARLSAIGPAAPSPKPARSSQL